MSTHRFVPGRGADDPYCHQQWDGKTALTGDVCGLPRENARHRAVLTDTEAMDELAKAWRETGDEGWPGADAVDLIADLLHRTDRMPKPTDADECIAALNLVIDQRDRGAIESDWATVRLRRLRDWVEAQGEDLHLD